MYDGQYSPTKQFQDIDLRCSCGSDFVWTAGEQKFLNNLQLEGKIGEVKQPMRCPACRMARKQRQNFSKYRNEAPNEI